MNQPTKDKILNIVKSNYEDIAIEFNETRKKYIWPALDGLAADIKSGERVLDVGCGNGRLLEALSDKQIEYLGTDNSVGLIKLAQKNYPAYNFVLCDILELDKISENNFKHIFNIAVLHHLPGRELQVEALKQMNRKLSPDGKIIVSVWNLWGQNKYLKLILTSYFKALFSGNKLNFGDMIFFWKNSKGEKVSRRYYHAFTPRELKKISLAADLKIDKFFTDKNNFYLVLKP